MRVLQINSVCGVGSTGRIAKDLSEIMTENNIENYILYGVSSSNYSLAIKVGGELNIRMHQLNTRLLGWHGYSSHDATMQFILEIERLKPDIIHLHNIHGFYLNIDMLFRYLAKIDKPIVWTFHDCWPFTGHCAYFDFIGCEKWRTGCYDCCQKKSYPVSWWFDRSKAQWERKRELILSLKGLNIVTPSKWLSDLVKQSFLKNYPIKVINNGIDLNVFKPTNTNLRDSYKLQNKFIVLGIASPWSKRKGLSFFLDLEKKLSDDFQIVLVGLNKKQKEEMPHGIIGITKTDSFQQLVELYSMADVFVNTTMEDNFPTVNIEALACGTPIITFKTGGSPEALDGNCGIVVEKGNIDEMVSAIIKMRGQHISRDICVNRANNFNKKNKFMEYINLYESM